MSGDWIKMRDDLTEDPAVVSIGAAAGLDEFSVVGRLHALWAWADKHSIDGNAVSVTPSWIDRKVACVGFASAMIEARWLESDGKTVTFPRFDRHNGETAKKRAVTNKRVAEHRELKRFCNDEGNASDVTPVTHDALHKALPEKRREEKKEQDQNLLFDARASNDGPSRFAEFWSTYPTKVGRKPCAAKWKARKLDRVADVILADVRRRAAEDRKWRDGYVPNPETYLNQERWNDGDAAAARGAAPSAAEQPDWMAGVV